MTLSLRVGGVASKPTDVSPTPVGQRFASSDRDTTKITYEFFNELIENFTLAQVAYAVTNVPNDPNALKKLLDSVRTGGYSFTTGTINTSNNNITLGTGKLYFTANDYIEFDDATNTFSFIADSGINNSILSTNALELIGSSNYISSDRNISLIVDADNDNPSNGLIVYSTSVATANKLMDLTEGGDLSIYSRGGDEALRIFDLASNETLANPYLSFHYNATVGGSATRIGYVGFASTSNQDLSISNETTSGNIELKTNGKAIIKNVAGGDILSLVDDNATTPTLANPILSFNYANGGAITRAGYVGFGSVGNDSLYLLNDTGDIIISPATNIINVSNSTIENSNAINFGNEDLSLYRENITFTATFYNGSTLITGSSGTSNVASYDARFSRIGNIVTVTISNIVWSVGGNAGTTLGSYPALGTTGEFSIRGLPYNALKDSSGSIIGFYNGSGEVNVGTAYIIAGTNNIRFSETGFGGGFGIRGVTITYMV